jgi:hypothetical protein
MTRFVPLGMMVALVVGLAGCGAVFVGFVSNPGVVPSSMSGTVTIVFLGIPADANGTSCKCNAGDTLKPWYCKDHGLLWRAENPIPNQPEP